MSGERRTVRTTQQFFEDLDRQLPPDRGPNGEPSAHDFQVYELLRVVEQFALEFDSMAELIPGRPDYRGPHHRRGSRPAFRGNRTASFRRRRRVGPPAPGPRGRLGVGHRLIRRSLGRSFWWEFDPSYYALVHHSLESAEELAKVTRKSQRELIVDR